MYREGQREADYWERGVRVYKGGGAMPLYQAYCGHFRVWRGCVSTAEHHRDDFTVLPKSCFPLKSKDPNLTAGAAKERQRET